MADPLLDRKFPVKALNQAVAMAAMCLQEEASVRPLMSDVVTTLSFLLSIPDDPASGPLLDPSPPAREESMKNGAHFDHGSSSDDGGVSDHHEGSENEEDESEDSEEEEGSGEKMGSRPSNKSSMSLDSSISSSRHKKGGSKRLSHKESVASTTHKNIVENGTTQYDGGSISSSSSSRGSFTLGRSSSKRSHSNNKSIFSSSGKSSRGEYDRSLSRSHSKASSGDIRIQSRSSRGSSRKERGVSLRGTEEEEEEEEVDSVGSIERESHDEENVRS